jgi:hypothetical protein
MSAPPPAIRSDRVAPIVFREPVNPAVDERIADPFHNPVQTFGVSGEPLRAHKYIRCSKAQQAAVLEALGVSGTTHASFEVEESTKYVNAEKRDDYVVVDTHSMAGISHIPSELPPLYTHAKHVVFVDLQVHEYDAGCAALRDAFCVPTD